MTGEEAVSRVIDVLVSLKIPNMLVGSFSSNFYGVGRSTNDADFVVQLGTCRMEEIAQRLGPDFRHDPQMSFETVTMTVRHAFSVKESAFRLELFQLSDDAHDQERFNRRREVSLLGRIAFLPTAEDVIITKLRWSAGRRGKDWDDIRDVIAVQGPSLDWSHIHSWCERHGTRSILDDIRASLPPLSGSG
jgi:hypothetical protein